MQQPSAAGGVAEGWPLTPKINKATWTFLGLSDMEHGLLKDSDMRDYRF